MSEVIKEGWGPPDLNGRKWHHYQNGKSLCGKYAWLGSTTQFEQGNDESPDNCAICKRKMRDRKQMELSKGVVSYDEQKEKGNDKINKSSEKLDASKTSCADDI